MRETTITLSQKKLFDDSYIKFMPMKCGGTHGARTISIKQIKIKRPAKYFKEHLRGSPC
jgi:hypothetical protein